MKEKPLFDNSRYCKRCSRIMAKSYTEEYCPACKNQLLFDEVRDFLRKNDATENELSERFNIPLSTIHEWIKDGRIEYKGSKNRQIIGAFCQVCGASISFGTVCTACKRTMNMKGTYTGGDRNGGSGKMRFL